MACSICARLPDVQHANTGRDEYLPPPSRELVRLELDRDRDLWRCPECDTFYVYEDDTSWTGSGNNDEERLTRLAPEHSTTVRAVVQRAAVAEADLFALPPLALEIVLAMLETTTAAGYAERLVHELARWPYDHRTHALLKRIVELDRAHARTVLTAIERSVYPRPSLLERLAGHCRSLLGVEDLERPLLAAVYAAPEQDAPRSVLADYYLERTNPRGELIALQLERARTGASPSARERELLAAHGAAWCGGLADLVAPDFDFERGFLARGRARGPWTLPALGRYIGLDEWSTVTAFTCPPVASREIDETASKLLGHAAMRALARLHHVPGAVALAIERSATPPPLVELGVRDGDAAALEQLGAVAFGAVRTLAVAKVDGVLDPISRSPLWKRLETVVLASVVPGMLVPATYHRFVAGHPHITRLQLIGPYVDPSRPVGWIVTLDRTAEGWTLDARFGTESTETRGLAAVTIVGVLNGFSPGTLHAIRIADPETFRWSESNESVRRACHRLQPARLELPP